MDVICARDERRSAVRITAGAVVAALALTSIVVIGVVGGATPAGALPAARADVTDMTNGRVEAIVRAGGRIFLGGTFTAVGPTRGSMVRRSYLAALDATTGRLDGRWTTQANGAVSALRASPDGQWLYVGGQFTAIGGQTRMKIAKISTATGAVAPWNPGANARVRAIATAGNRVYVGGGFTVVGGRSIPRLARIDATTGAVNTGFQPRPDTAPRAIDVSSDGRVLVVGGNHTTLAGARSPYLGSVDGGTGRDLGWRPTAGGPIWTLDLNAAGTEVYTGSRTNRVEAWPLGSGRRGPRWSVWGDGNVQGVAASASTVYLGGHFDRMGGQVRRHLAAVVIATGAVAAWTPQADSPYGVGAVAVHTNAVYIGGDFDYVAGRLQMRFARFSGPT